jgi:hypothetical protein
LRGADCREIRNPKSEIRNPKERSAGEGIRISDFGFFIADPKAAHHAEA